MEKLNLRLFWAVFYGILWLTFGRNVSLTVLFSHIVVMPFLFMFSKWVRAQCFYAPIAMPFLRFDDPKKFGLDGARNFDITFESTVDNCTINIGLWHALPKSLVKKYRFQLNSGSKDEINNLFTEELKNSEYPIFLYFHGIIGTRASPYRVDMYNLVQNLDAHVITFDYRGFGDSTNVVPRKIGVVEDGLVVYSWIRSVVGNDRTVFIWGHSMGSAIAQRVFSKLKLYSHSLLNLKEALPPPQGFVLEGGFNSNVEVSKEFILGKVANWLPYFEKIVLNVMMNSENRYIPENYAVFLTQYPIIILHSRDDGVIAYHFGETVHPSGEDVSTAQMEQLFLWDQYQIGKRNHLPIQTDVSGSFVLYGELYEKHKSVRKEGDSPVIFKTFESDGHLGICKNPATPAMIKDFITKHNRVVQL